MQTLSFTQWELRELTMVYHEQRNAWLADADASLKMKRRANRLFDKLRFAEFNGRRSKRNV